jgi:tRNA (cytidine/uridine-2'-O-)-methyltransferase
MSSVTERAPSGSRAESPDPELHVVLVEPEIPPNTGSIARLSAATRARLHLVRPLGFSLDDRYLKRAGLDYWPWVDLRVHDDWRSFLRAEKPPRLLCFSARAETSYLDAPLADPGGLYLVFGCETKGLPDRILAEHASATYRIPVLGTQVRSLNLANAVAIVVYEALRRRGRLESTGARATQLARREQPPEPQPPLPQPPRSSTNA